jgi:putative spermidine/putrescine transport system ATP-binding protein
VTVTTSQNMEVKALKVNCGEVGTNTTLSIRPERIHLNSKYKNKADATIKQLIYHGDHIRCLIKIDKDNDFIVKIPNSNIKSTLKIGEKIPISWDTMDCHALDA